MLLALLFHYLLLNMFRMLVHPSSGTCNLFWVYFLGCIALVWCVLVLWCGSAGVVWYPYAGWSNASAYTNTDQLDVTCFIISLFTTKHVSNVSTSIFRSLRLIVDYFMGCIALVRCVLVLRCGKAGVVWYPYTAWSTSASACINPQ